MHLPEELLGLGCDADRFSAAVEPAESLRHAAQDFCPPAPIGRLVEKSLVSIKGRLGVARCKQEIGLEPAWPELVASHELADGEAKPVGDERQRRHRWLCVAQLESADVGGGVSALRKLSLRLASAKPSLSDACPDLPGEGAVVDYGDLPPLSSSSLHGWDYNPPAKSPVDPPRDRWEPPVVPSLPPGDSLGKPAATVSRRSRAQINANTCVAMPKDTCEPDAVLPAARNRARPQWLILVLLGTVAVAYGPDQR